MTRGTLFPYIGENDLEPRIFIGREDELRFLNEKLGKKEPKLLSIVGPKGIGKTALMMEYHKGPGQRFGNLMLSRLDGMPEDVVWRALDKLQADQQLIVCIDVLKPIDLNVITFSQTVLDLRHVHGVVVIGREIEKSSLDIETIELAGLTANDAQQLLYLLLHNHGIVNDLPEHEIELLQHRAQGNPRTLITIAYLLKDHTVQETLFKLDHGLGEFNFLLPISDSGIIEVVAPKIVLANEAFLENLKKYPDDLYRISPRKFEELIAELLDDMGCEVQLTPAVKDGGKDIIATMQTELGEVLCLVEAKHYRADRPVEVSLVRQLFGTYMDFGATSAMLVTSSTFTRGAKEFQARHKYQISLKEYTDVVRWIRKYKSGSS